MAKSNTTPETVPFPANDLTPEETVEAPVTEEELKSLSDIASLVLASQRAHVADYNVSSTKVTAATGDTVKYVSELRTNSDDAVIVEFRKWQEEIDAQREAAVSKVDQYIKANLIGESLSDEAIAAEQTRLAALKKEIDEDMAIWKIVTKNLPKDFSSLLATREGSRTRTVTHGTNTAKPRVSSVYVNDKLMSHVVKDKKAGTETVKSTFSDAVKFMSDNTKTKVQVSDLHKAYAEAAGVTIEKIADAGNEVDFIYMVGDTKFDVLITKDEKPVVAASTE